MYTIAFDLLTEQLKKNYKNPSFNNAYAEIREALRRFGFSNQQGSVYFGNENTTAVDCVIAVQSIAKTHNWFVHSVQDIRMLRIEDNSDLMPAIKAALA